MTDAFGPGGPADTGISPAPASQFEPTTEAVPTTAVELLAADGGLNTPVANPRRRRLRWTVAIVATVAVIAGSTLGFAVLASARSASQVLPWAPADAVLYAEVRADLPGDQRANLLAFLSKFPGFADQASFDAKADDGLNRLVKHLTNDKHDFSTEIKPWFGGQIGVSIEGSKGATPAELIVVSVRDVTGATAWLKSITPADATHQTSAGIDLTVPASPSGTPTSAYALDGSVILAGTIDSVKAAIARGPSGALAGVDGFKAAAGSLGGDELGSMYIDVKGYINWFTSFENQMLSGQSSILQQVGGQLGSGLESSPLELQASPMAFPTMNTSLLPGWMAMRVRAESDHLLLEAVVPTTPGGSLSGTNHPSALAASLPASTIFQYEIHDTGKLIQNTLTQIEALPGGPSVAEVDKIAKYVGGVDKAVGWLGDADIVVAHDSAGFSGGLVAQTSDPTASANLLASLKNLVALSGGQAGITVSTEQYAGQTISLVSADLGQLGGPGGMGMAGPSGKVELAIAQTDSLVIASVGDTFVKSVLDTKAGSSLADQAAYKRAIGIAGASNGEQMFVDLTAVRTAIEALGAKSPEMAAYDSNVKPYLVPIESVALSVSLSNGIADERLVLVLK